MNVNIIAKGAGPILFTLGGVGWLGNIPGAGWLLVLGAVVQLAPLARFLI